MRSSLFLGILFFAALGLALGSQGIAQTKAPSNTNKVGDRFYQKKTVYDFSNDTISGDLTRPDGEYIEARRSIKHQRLIKLREHFKDRMRQSVNDL